MGKIEPVAAGSLSARTYLNLRDALIAGSFAPGERLLMNELAERLGTSVTPIREACFRLVSERALELRSGRFINVPELTKSRYLQIRVIRMALEGLAAELAVEHVRKEDIDKLEDLQRQFARADRAGESDESMRLNREFHFGAYRLAKMEMLTAQIESLWVSMGPILNVFYKSVENSYVGAEEHLNLIDAFRKRNKKAARKAIEQDILRGGENLLKFLESRESRSAAAK
jgi:DNA-binding GntR family transcriptional regulator